MFNLSHFVAALASVLPILFAIQKGRNGDFDFIYQRTIDYTSSFQMSEVLSLLLPIHTLDFVAPVGPLMNITNTTNAEPVSTQIDMQPAYLNATAEPLYSTPKARSVFHRYRQAALTVVDAWLGISKSVLLVFRGVIRMMEDMKDFSAELLIHHHDFSHTATPRTRKALVIAFKSLLRSFGRHVLPFSVIMAILVKLFVVISFLVSIGLGYYVYTLLQALAKGKEVLKQQEATSTELRAHAETLERDLRLQVKLLAKGQEGLKRHQRTAEQLRAHANTVQEDLNQRTRLLSECQGDVKRHERNAEKLQAHAESLQQDLDQQKKPMEDQRVEMVQRSANLQLKDSQAKIVSLEEESQAQLELHGRAQEKAQDEAQRSRAGLQALDAAVEVQRQRAEKWQRQARTVDTKHSETTRRLDTLNVMYENLKKTLKGKNAEVEELSGERNGLARKAEGAEATAQELRDIVQKLETDVVSQTSATISLKQQLRDSQGQVHETAAEMEKLNSVNKELSLKVVEALTRSQSLMDEVRQLKENLSGRSSAVEESKLLAERHRSSSEQKAAEVVYLQRRLNEVSQEVAAAQLVGLTAEERVKGLEGDLELKTWAVEAAEQQAVELRNTLDRRALEMASLKSELDALGHDQTEASWTQEALQERTRALQSDLELKTSAIETLEAQAEQGKRSLSQTSTDLTNAETRLVALRQDNKMVHARAEKLQERVSRLEQELDVKATCSDAYERTSEHQGLVLESRSTEHAVALERVKSLEGDLKVLQAQLTNTSHDGDNQADPPVVKGDDTDNDLVAEAEAQRLAQNAEHGFNAQSDTPESQEVVGRTGELEEAPARRRGHRSKRRRGGKRQAAKRRPLTRRHSFGSHGHRSCSRCGGRLPVSVACLPQELQRAGWRKPAEGEMPVHKRRHSLDSLALKPCPECGGPLPVELDVVSRARTMLEDDEASTLSTEEVKRPQLPAQAAEPTVPGHSDPPLASPAFSTASHTPQQDETSVDDGAPEQGAGLPAGTSSAKTKRRRRQRAKGAKATI